MAEEIKLLQEEIIDLTDSLVRLNRTVASTTESFGQQMNRVVKASQKGAQSIQQFTAATEEGTKTTKQNTQATKEATAATKINSITKEKETEATKLFTKEQQAAKDAIREFGEANRRTTNYMARLAEDQLEAAKQSSTLASYFQNLNRDSLEYQKRLILAQQVLGPLTKGLGEMGKALYEGKQGASVNNSALEGLGDAAEKLGTIVGKIVKWFTGYVIEANKLSDRLYKSYQDLSKVGITAQDGMMGLAESAQRLGLGLDEAGIENFGRLMKSAAVDLALMSGSAAQGRRDFTEFASEVVRGEAGRELMNLGMSVEQVNEGLASYAGLQARVGLAQNKTQAQLAAGATAYLKEMDMLTKLTGLQRQELEEGINKARAVEAFRAKVEDLRAQGREKEADQMEQYYAVLQKQAPKLAQGYAESAAGMIVSAEGRQFFQAIDSGANVVQGLSTGAMNATQALGATYKQAKLSEEQFRGLAMAMAAGDVIGSYTELADIAKRSGIDTEEAARLIREVQESQVKGPGGVAAQTDMRRAQMDTRDALQNMVLKGVQPATSAMAGFSQVVGKVTQALGGPAPKMGSAPGTVGVFGGGGGGGGGAAAPGGGGAGAYGGTGGKTFQGGVFGAVENFITQGKGFGSYGAGAGGAGAGSQSKILDFIGNIESRGNYNVLVGGKSKTDPPLTEMTVSQVLDFQSQMRAMGHESTAVGKYQILRNTLSEIMGKAGVGPDDKFDQGTQDKLAVALMKRRGLDQFQQGAITADQYADSLAKEWASLPMANGQSAYAGTGSNKSLVSRDEFVRAISAQTGGVFAGPKSGYAAMLHGNEAVVPLPDGKTIPVEMPNLDRNMQEQVSMMGAQLVALEELVRYMRDNNAINTKILQAANN